MKIFKWREQRAAMEYAARGWQALHVFPPSPFMKIPARHPSFKRANKWAHLFDQDYLRLLETSRKLGIASAIVEHFNQPGQHVDLCGKPLAKAMKAAE